ncbi:MAG: 3-keto-5-aminohexanoate cleavage protein [Acidobacteriota bacterium]
MLIKVALNGGRTGAPGTAEEIASDVAECAGAGATHFHVHPRAGDGTESLLPGDADRVVAVIRATSPEVQVGLTTGAWILPDVPRRLDALSHWSELPDFASVNFDEDGCDLVAQLLVERRVGVEAGILDAASTQRFLAAGIPVVRVLIELQEQRLAEALQTAGIIVDLLGDHSAPRLLHGHGAVAWELLDEAARLGYDSRIGLEDVRILPDGRAARNVELYLAAVARAQSVRSTRSAR